LKALPSAREVKFFERVEFEKFCPPAATGASTAGVEPRCHPRRKVLIESGINYVEVANEAAFSGPKIDVQVWRCWRTATTSAANSPSPRTRWTSPCPLVAVRKDFGLTYHDKDN
jgi:hypothetical protein